MRVFLTALLVFLSILSGCNNGSSSSGTSNTETYKMKTLPSNFLVGIPESLSSSGSSARSNISTNAFSYDIAKSIASTIPTVVSRIIFNAIVLDDLINNELIEVGACYDKGEVSITYSEGMINLHKSLEKDAFGEEVINLEELSGITEANSKPFTVDASPIGYSGMLKLGFSNTVCSNFNSSSELMHWGNGDLQYTFDFAELSQQALHGGFGYDNDSQTMSVAFRGESSGSEYMMSGTYSVCGSDCVNFRNFFSGSGMVLDMRGRADSNGGYGISRFIYLGNDYWIEEYWDDSDIKFQQLSQCNANFDNYSSCSFSDNLNSSDNTGLTGYKTSDFGSVYGENINVNVNSNQSFSNALEGTVYLYMSDNSSLLSEYIVGAGVKVDNSTISSTFFKAPKNGDIYYLRELFTQNNYGVFDTNTSGSISISY